MVGRTISDYQILSRLGAGAMGEVFLARDTRLDRQVAFKVLPPDVARDPERLARFEREARAVAALNHPNIVTLHAVGEADGVHFLTMEYVEGRTLADLIPSAGLPPAEALAIAVPLADALAAVHERQITHRDLKPQNVMVTGEGRVKVLDFGLARLRPETSEEETTPAGGLTEDGRVMGTPAYMAPEQAKGKPADARSDIFAFGAILHEMLTGARPFDGASPAEVLSAILKDTPRPVSTLNPAVPSALERVVRRCLEKDPRRRYQSALDLRNDLEELSRARRNGDSGSRSAVIVAIGAVVLTAILAAAAVWFAGGWRSAPDRPIESLAVLPFDNLMNDPEEAYFVEGIHETLITALARVRSVRVISRTSVMRYQGTDRPLPEIARELGVDALVEGSVLRVGDRVRITAQLIRGASDEHVWANNYDRDVGDVFGLMSDVAQAISGEIEAAVAPQPRPRRPVNPEAQQAYLRGRYHLHRMTRQDTIEGIALTERAIALDPAFAEAHSTLAAGYLEAIFVGAMPPEKAASLALTAARRALALDDGLGEAHGVMGWVTLYFDWDWPSAEQRLLRALELNPNHAIIRHGYADYLLVMGRLDESLEQVRLGQLHDPLAPVANGPVVGHLMFLRRYEDAIAEARRIMTRMQSAGFHRWIGDALWQLGRYEEALSEYRKVPEHDAALLDAMEDGYRTGGATGALVARARHLEAVAETEPVDPLTLAGAYAAAGKPDAAFVQLERAFAARSPYLLHLKANPEFDALHGDPRFTDLLHRIGFPA